MKQIIFFLIAVFCVALAMFIEQLNGMYPDIFEPIYQFIVINGGADVLYITGFLALVIAIFSWLSTWMSILLFVILMVGGGYIISNEGVDLKVGNITVL